MEHAYSDVLDKELGETMLSHDHNGPIMVHITKLYLAQDDTKLHDLNMLLVEHVTNHVTVM